MRPLLLPLLLLASACCLASSAAGGSGQLPLTTRSAQARKLFERGMNNLENLRIGPAVNDWRSAAKADPQCALAHLFVAYGTKDPAEERNELGRALKLAASSSEGEKLLVKWFAGTREGNYVQAIAAMNDLLAMFPQDSRLAFLAGRWFILAEEFEPGVKLLERALAGNAEYPAALNELGYGYAELGHFEKAFTTMERYAAAAPTEPNPHDSYGEVLRMAGEFDRALLQYRAALKVDPKFYASQFGIAETYALRGDEERARAEYEKAIAASPSAAEKLEYARQSALTYVREGKNSEADAALQQLVSNAKNAGIERLEAELHRLMAIYATDYAEATRHLDSAEAVLARSQTIAKADWDDERASILRVRAERAASAAELNVARNTVDQLQAMAAGSRSQMVQRSFHAGAGALLVAQGHFAESIAHLEEDQKNCMTARLLLSAYQKTGAGNDAESLRHRLAMTNETSAEQALVVPRLRRQLAELASAH